MVNSRFPSLHFLGLQYAGVECPQTAPRSGCCGYPLTVLPIQIGSSCVWRLAVKHGQDKAASSSLLRTSTHSAIPQKLHG